jgi:hypothetical protein
MIVADTGGLQSRVRRWHGLGPSPDKPCGDKPIFFITSSIKFKRGADLNITNSNHLKIIFVRADPGSYVLLLFHYSNYIAFLHAIPFGW